MPIIGTIDSSKSGNLYQASFDSIATVSVGAGGTSSITFSSIPAEYTHLQIRYLARTNRADITDSINIRFNSDTGNNYAWHYLRGNGSFVNASSITSTSNIDGGTTVAQTGGSNMFGAGVIDILDYANTNKNTTTRSLSGEDRNTTGFVYYISGVWVNTNAVTSVVLIPSIGTSFSQYSSFALYGIKVA